MTTLREAAQMALDALLNFPDDISDDMFESIKALRAALAQPEQEPVAWCFKESTGNLFGFTTELFDDEEQASNLVPLYTAPPQREWQGLTDEERAFLAWESENGPDCVEMTEFKLWEKNR
jgi:hypothetical protein